MVNSYTKQKNTLCKSPSTSLSYDLHFVLNNQKASKQKSGKKFNDYSTTVPKIQGLYATVQTLCTVIQLRKGGGVWGHQLSADTFPLQH